MSAAASLAEADLHAFVDGVLEPERRTAVLRQLSASPADRARADAWQNQNDLIRAAFAGIEHEALPATLDLAPVRHLRRVAEIEPVPVAPIRARSSRVFAGLISACLVAAGIGGAWIVLAPDDTTTQTIANAPLRDTIDATLAASATEALTGDARSGLRFDGAAPAVVPDLTAAGFVLTRVSTEPTQPVSLVLHYENADAERLVISVARARGGTTVAPKRVGTTYSWRQRETAFALAGTLKPDRLHAIALALQGSD